MKNLINVACVLLMVTTLSCSGKKKNSSDTSTAIPSSIVGTYEAVVPSVSADDPAVYTLFALNATGEYELYQKILGRADSYLSKGNFEVKGDSVRFLHHSVESLFVVKNDQLFLGETAFQKLSSNTELEPEYKLFSIKENKSGEIVQVALYTKDSEGYAEFEFNGNSYQLKEDIENGQERLFVDGSTMLIWNIVDPAPLANYQPVLRVGATEYTFTLVNPINCQFVAQKEGSTPNTYDVLYFNLTQGKSFVKLLSETTSITLPQVEASAKTAEYALESIGWSVNNNNVATLTINGESSDYVEVKR